MAWAIDADERAVQKYLDDIEANKIPVFVSECQIGGGTATLIIPISKEKYGLFIQRYRGVPVNVAAVIVDEGEFTVEDAPGGLSTRRKIFGLVDQLLALPFHQVRSQDVKGLVISKPKVKCNDKDPG